MNMPFRLRNPLLTIAFVTLFGLSACNMHADDGTWAGDVQVTDPSPQGYACTANVNISHTDTLVSINSLDTYCGADSLHWAPPSFVRSGSGGYLLYLGDMQIGQIDAYDTVHVEIPQPSITAGYPRQADRLDLTWVLDGPNLNLTLTEWYGNTPHTMNVALNRNF